MKWKGGFKTKCLKIILATFRHTVHAICKVTDGWMKSLFKRECNLWCDYVSSLLPVSGPWVCLYAASWTGPVAGGTVEPGRPDPHWNHWGPAPLTAAQSSTHPDHCNKTDKPTVVHIAIISKDCFIISLRYKNSEALTWFVLYGWGWSG